MRLRSGILALSSTEGTVVDSSAGYPEPQSHTSPVTTEPSLTMEPKAFDSQGAGISSLCSVLSNVPTLPGLKFTMAALRHLIGQRRSWRTAIPALVLGKLATALLGTKQDSGASAACGSAIARVIYGPLQSSLASTSCAPAPVWPNNSFNRTRYGRHRKAGPEAHGASSQPGLTVPASAGRLTRTLCAGSWATPETAALVHLVVVPSAPCRPRPAASNPLFASAPSLAASGRSLTALAICSITCPLGRSARRAKKLARCAGAQDAALRSAPSSFHFVHQLGACLVASPTRATASCRSPAGSRLGTVAVCPLHAKRAFARAAHNPSLNRTRYGRPPGRLQAPHVCYHRLRRPGVPPPRAG